jgi:hypothetical protein
MLLLALLAAMMLVASPVLAHEFRSALEAFIKIDKT